HLAEALILTEEKCLAAAVVEMREHDRPADGHAELVAREWRNAARIEIVFVIEEIASVEGGVADKFKGTAMNLVGAGLGDDVGEASRAVADFGGHHAAAGLHFLDRVDVEIGKSRAAQLGIGSIRAIEREDRGYAALPVHGELLREVCGAVGVG